MNKAWKVDAAGVGVLALLTGAGYLAGLGPFLSARVAKARHEIALSSAREERDDQRSQARLNQQRLESKIEEGRRLNVELRPVSFRYGQTSALARLATESGLAISQMDPEAAKNVAGVVNVQAVPMVLSGEGSYAQIGEFLRAIHEEHRDTAVDQFNLRVEPGSAGTLARFSVRLHWFARSESTR